MAKQQPKREASSRSSTQTLHNLGKWLFLVGVILALVIAVLQISSTIWLGVLVLIGIIVGLINIAKKEVTPFLMSGAVLIIASALGQVSMSSLPIVTDVLDALLAILVPATIIVAMKNLWTMAKD